MNEIKCGTVVRTALGGIGRVVSISGTYYGVQGDRNEVAYYKRHLVELA